MRRYVALALFLLVLVTPFLLRRLYGTSDISTPRDALQLVVVTSHVEGIRREFAEAFSDWHQRNFGQPVFIDYRLPGGASEIVKYFEASKESLYDKLGTFKIDVVWGGGDYLFDVQLKRPGFLEPIRLNSATMSRVFPKADLNGVALYDAKDGTWYGAALSSFGICFNKDVCRYLGTPQPSTWNDLTDPRYVRWLVMADPTRSASAKQSFMTVVERAMADASTAGRSEDDGWADGMGLVRLMASNARMFTDAGSSAPGFVGTGDAAAAMVIDFYGRSQVDAVGENRMGYVEPIGATAITPDPIAVVRGSEHRELAIRFVEFVLSDEGQRLWNTRAGAPGGPRQTSLRRLPIAPGAYADLPNFTDPVNPYATSGSFNTSAARRATFPILGELIQISCMDLLDDLRKTRNAILDAHRADLDAQLGRFPFDQKEALRRAALWRDAAPLERLRLQRQWTDEFRAEYRRLRDLAKQSQPHS